MHTVYVRYDKGFMALYTEMQSTKHSIFVHSVNDIHVLTRSQ